MKEPVYRMENGKVSQPPMSTYELKTRIHDRLLYLIDLSLIESLDEEKLRQEIRKLVEKILQEEKQAFP